MFRTALSGLVASSAHVTGSASSARWASSLAPAVRHRESASATCVLTRLFARLSSCSRTAATNAFSCSSKLDSAGGGGAAVLLAFDWHEKTGGSIAPQARLPVSMAQPDGSAGRLGRRGA